MNNEKPSLEGRTAQCGHCSAPRPSSYDLPFFEHRGEGSPDSIGLCKNCKYHEIAHVPENQAMNEYICNDFIPHGPYEFDRYYCGCRGWD